MHQLKQKVFPSASFILFMLLLLTAWSVSARDDFQFQFQPNPRDQLGGFNEVRQIRIAQQYGLGYLPLKVMRQHRLIEKHANQYGLGNVRVNWLTFPNGKKMNQALETGFLDIASGGLVPMISAWDRTRNTIGIKGLAALSAMPAYLNTRNPRVKLLADFSDQDRIALPAPGASYQAVILQMATAAELGRSNAAFLDKLTVAMRHPDAEKALVADNSTITAHFTSPPYQYQELKHPGIHKVLSSYDVLGGPATFTALWSAESFVSNNPHTIMVFMRALREAMHMIERDHQLAATTYIQQGGSIDLSESDIITLLKNPEHRYSTVPLNVMKVADFMYQTGKIKNRPASADSLFSYHAVDIPRN